MADPAIVNSSPLILLARIGRLDLLQAIGNQIQVPETVADEVRAHSDQATLALKKISWLLTVPDVPLPEAVSSWDLGAGESAVLAHAFAHPSTVAILDDYAARKCAEVLSLRVKGTLGIVLLSKTQGRIPLARPVVEELHRKGLYLSPAVIEAALKLVGE